MRYLSVESLRLMCDLMHEHGLDASLLCEAASLDLTQLRDPTCRVSARAELAAIRQFRRACAHLPDLAVLIGSRYRLATFGSLGMAMLSAPTIADSVQTAMRYQSLNFSWMRFSVTLSAEAAQVGLDASQAPLDLRDFLMCRDVAAACAMLRDLAGDEVNPLAVSLNLADASQSDGLAEFLSCPVRVGAGDSTMAVPLALLGRTNRHHSVSAYALCLAACDAQTSQVQDDDASPLRNRDVSVRVESLLNGHPGRLLPHDVVASMLGASERTLRRQLAMEGTSFRDVRERVMRSRAQQLLSATSLPVADVAEQLGFADASTFCQAFRRWVGCTPSVYRKAARPDELTYDLSTTF